MIDYSEIKTYCARNGHAHKITFPITLSRPTREAKGQCKFCGKVYWEAMAQDAFDNLLRNVKSGKIK